MKDFFISYNSSDRGWAEWIAWTLTKAGYSVVIQAWHFRPGQNFPQEMNAGLQNTRRLIIVLSNNWLHAEYTMVEWTAFFAKDPLGKKRLIIPIRIAECSPKGLLKPLIYAEIISLSEGAAKEEVLRAVANGPIPPRAAAFPGLAPSPSPKLTGPVPFPGSSNLSKRTPQPGSRFDLNLYVSRPSEEGLILTRFKKGSPAIIIWGPKKLGKTWLLKKAVKMIAEANPGTRQVMLSVDQLEPDAEHNLDSLLLWLGRKIIKEVNGDQKLVSEVWNQTAPGPKDKLSDLMEKHVLPSFGPLLLTLDRADDLLRHNLKNAEYFFTLLRNWVGAEEPWPSFRLILAVSTRPSNLIKLLPSSPFNLSPAINLSDFDDYQISELATQYGVAMSSYDKVRLRNLVGGHPFLSSLAFEELAAHPNSSLKEILKAEGKNLFGNYLEELRHDLQKSPQLMTAVRILYRDINAPLDEDILHELERAGLIVLAPKRRWRCQLYKELIRSQV